jgi:hypothetical protein
VCLLRLDDVEAALGRSRRERGSSVHPRDRTAAAPEYLGSAQVDKLGGTAVEDPVPTAARAAMALRRRATAGANAAASCPIVPSLLFRRTSQEALYSSAALDVPGHDVSDSRLMGGRPLRAVWRRRVL